MTRSRAAACIVALVLLAPTALAGSDLVARELVLAGATRLEGDATALFYLAREDSMSWEVSADAATLTREHATYAATDHPLMETYLTHTPSAWRTEETTYGRVSLTSTSTLPWGAMLAMAGAASVRAASEGLVEVRAVRDPTLGQVGSPDARASGADEGEIVRQFAGDHLHVTFAEGTYTLTGDLTLILYGPAYTLATDEGSTEWQTGEYETKRAALYSEGRQERHTLALTNAVLQMRGAAPATLLTTFPTLTLDGTLQASEPEGALVVGGRTLAAPEAGPLTFRGAAELALAAEGGFVAASAPAALGPAAATVAPRAPPLLAIGAAALAGLAALALLGVLLWRRRAGEDDLELALLAMEERRWEDALPRLARVHRRDPDNVQVLVDRALCLEQVGRFEEAARSFEAALRVAPALAEAHFYYARTLAKMREAGAARAHLEEALERDPRLVEMAHREPALRGL